MATDLCPAARDARLVLVLDVEWWGGAYNLVCVVAAVAFQRQFELSGVQALLIQHGSLA
jgi:hypothetical protein